MRTMINATLSFGAIFVPVGVASAASRNEIKFRTLHVDCGQPIKKKDRCPACEQDLTSDDLVKGWEYAKNQFVQVDEAQMDSLTVPRSRMIDLHKFVAREEVKPAMIDRSYFLTPNEVLHQPYELLSVFLMRRGLAAVGKATLWGKEFPVTVDSEQGVLMVRYLFCADEIRTGDEIAATLNFDVSNDELDMLDMWAKKKKKIAHLTQEDLTNESRALSMEYLDALAKGATFVTPAPSPEPMPTIDMMKALKAMVK